MVTIGSFIVVLIVFSILIVVHEFGHLLAAKSVGVKVERFSIGFGPILISFKHKDTQYALSLVPLGGYVKLAGDDRKEFKGKPWEYFSRSVGERSRIIFFGPVLNYVLAALCFCFVFLLGYPNLTSKVGELIEGYPAQSAGILAGDQIIRVDETYIHDWEELQNIIRQKKQGQINLTVLRDEEELQFTILPRIEKIKNIFGQELEVALIGIKPQEEIIYIKYNLFSSIKLGIKKLFFVTGMTYKAIFRMITGALSVKESVTGPLGIFYITQQAVDAGISPLLYVIALISTSLTIFNLLPIPVLDGGHLLLLAIEKVKKSPLEEKTEDWINRFSMSLLIVFALFVFYNDIIRFGLLDKILNWWNNLIQ